VDWSHAVQVISADSWHQDERRPAIETISERGQTRAADWPKNFPGEKFDAANLRTPKSEWKWIPLAIVSDLQPNEKNTTSAAVRYGKDSQLAIFHVPGRGYYATQQMCPHKRAFVLDHGIVGDDKDGNLYVSCP
jgi:nitrite reductase (NAD(P)H)